MAVTTIGGVTVGDQANNHFAAAGLLAVGLEGHDRIYAATATGGHVLEGNTGADNLFFIGVAAGSLYGGEGNDLLSGGDGQDAMYGGEGDDWLGGNWQSETTTEADSLYGGAGRDALFGNGGDDVIYGGAGDDKGQIATASPDTYQDNLVDFTIDAGLYGGDGNDYLDGGAGEDAIEGGRGNDVMSGGTGADEFLFNTALGNNNVDRIADFSHEDGDTIVLASAIFGEIGPSLAKKEFVLGKKAKDANDYILVDMKKGTIAYDADGKGGEKAVVFATIEKGMTLAHTDFDIAT
ncbi:MAG TPA: calcium-binding protein [Bauldia sp.]|nr:calcium-binding protein [Bauldia sp.]